jgi:hypothetical protein
MEIDPENFEKLSSLAQEEDKKKTSKSKDNENKWTKLEQRFGK